ncbi:MAG: AAA family ATPase [Candidatus Magasanikbacteria bacterium]|nr:AAA family ATPase [Candidatus Magasanikbacteria bacterium]
MSEIIGHKEALDFFDKVIANNNLSHAYCFIGPEQVGKRRVAEEIAAKLLGVSRDKLGVQPDYTVVEQGFDEKTGKSKRDISVEQMRDLRSSLTRHSFSGGYKVAMIDAAEKMNIEAANALLKTLEEPTSRTVLFLITIDEEKLPETILSRCQRVYFHSVKKEELAGYLQKQRIERPELVNLAQGLPGRLIDWLDDEEKLKTYQAEADRFIQMIGKPFFSKLKSVEDLFGEKGGDIIATRENLDSVLGLWQVLARDFSLASTGLASEAIHQIEISASSRSNDWVKLEKRIITARGLLNQNIHPRLVVENILLDLP